jgi:hypothetical protein
MPTVSLRKAISKKTRFDVFKRDLFTCQYCGAHPPGVLLHVDHIVAVASGGTNDKDNLTTACEPCNAGKGARALTVAPEPLAKKAKRVAESEEQLRGYQSIIQARLDRIDDEAWRVADCLVPGSPVDGLSRQWISSIRKFVDRLGFHEVLEAAGIARDKFPYARGRSEALLRYFCGVCWKKIRSYEAGDA